MTIIVAGKLILHPNTRDKFIEQSIAAIRLARENEACDDFAVSADPIDIDRVNIFEQWKNIDALNAFRGSDLPNDSFSLVKSFEVNEYEIDG